MQRVKLQTDPGPTLEITIFRDSPLAQGASHLPAPQYNLARLLQSRSAGGVAFVPIRSMQILAILDADEFVFVDSQYKQQALVAWRRFEPQKRETLDDPVPFKVEFYSQGAREIQRRLQPELFKAMQLLSSRDRIDGPARVLKFERPIADGADGRPETT